MTDRCLADELRDHTTEEIVGALIEMGMLRRLNPDTGGDQWHPLYSIRVGHVPVYRIWTEADREADTRELTLEEAVHVFFRGVLPEAQ